MSHSISKLLLGAMCAGAIISTEVLVYPAYAQETESGKLDALEEIVVTARMREERLFDIPLAITAFSAQEIKAGGYQDFGEISMHTPGVEFDARSTQGFGGRNYSNIRIRGAQVAGVSPSQQSTSAFIDGVFVLGGINSIPLNDLSRVEIIKGPQSAYFGRNTFAGAVNYITRNPSLEEYETEISTTVASHDQYEVSAISSGPIVEGKLGYLVNARSMSRGALYTATDGGGLGEESTDSISGVLYWQPDDKWTVKLRVMTLRDEDGPPMNAYLKGSDYNSCAGKVFPGRYLDDGSPYTLDFTNGRPTTGEPVNYICGEPLGIDSPLARVSMNTGMQPTIFSTVDGIIDTSGRGFGGPPNPNLLYDIQKNNGVFAGVPYLSHLGMKRENQRYALNVDYDFSSGMNAALVAAYNTQDLQEILDFDRQDVEAYYAENPAMFDDTSVEVRLTSAQDRRFRWIVGATWYEQESVVGSGGASTFIIGQISAGYTGVLGTTATGGDKAEVLGLFGGLSYDFTENLTFDAEARAMRDTRTTSAIGSSLEKEYDSITPRFILSYRPDENTNLYGQYSLGTLPGQVNSGVLICSPDDFLVPYEDPYNPGSFIVLSECGQYARQGAAQFTEVQDLDAWEIGLKKKFLGGRLSLSAAAYYWEWSGKPSGISISLVRDASNPADRDGIPNPFPNAVGAAVNGSSKMKGIELEGGYLITDRWEANFAFNYTDTEWTEFSSGSLFQVTGTRNQKGNEEPWVPKLKGSLSTTYAREFNTEWDWFTRLDVVWQDKYFGDPENLLEGPSWTLTNLRVGLESHNGLRLELFVRNLFDEDAWKQVGRAIDYSRQPADFNFTKYWGASLVPQEPRTFGLRASMRF